jgi:hypothetical protein
MHNIRSVQWPSILLGSRPRRRSKEDGDSRGGGSDGKQTTTRDRKPPKVISPSDPSSVWTAKANKCVQFGYGLNYLINVEHAIIVDVEATMQFGGRRCWPPTHD